MNNNKDTIQSWLAEQLDPEVVEEQGVCTIIGLKHISIHGDDREVFSMKAGSPKWGNLEEMADLFFSQAARTAKGLIGYQQFQLEAIYGTSGKPLRVLPFGHAGMTQLGLSAGGTAMSPSLGIEPPTPFGQQSQAMRLTEQLVQGAFSERQHVSKTQMEIVDGLRTDNVRLNKENGELWIALKDVLAKMVQDGHARQLEILRFLKMQEFQRRLMQLAPGLINMMSGQEVFPKSDQDTSIMAAFAELLDETTVNKVLAGLPNKPEATEMIGLLTTRLAELRAQNEQQKADDRRMAKEATGRTYEEAEKDAGGEAVRILTQVGRARQRHAGQQRDQRQRGSRARGSRRGAGRSGGHGASGRHPGGHLRERHAHVGRYTGIVEARPRGTIAQEAQANAEVKGALIMWFAIMAVFALVGGDVAYEYWWRPKHPAVAPKPPTPALPAARPVVAAAPKTAAVVFKPAAPAPAAAPVITPATANPTVDTGDTANTGDTPDVTDQDMGPS